MDVATDLPAADQLTAAIMAVYDFYHLAFIMEAYGVKQLFAFHKTAFLLIIPPCFINRN